MKKTLLSLSFVVAFLALTFQSNAQCTVVISQPDQLAAVVSGSTVICYGATATISVNVTGGTQPYVVTYASTNYAVGGTPGLITFDVTLTDDATFDNSNITVTDAHLCTALISGSASVTIETTPPSITTCAGNRAIEGCDLSFITSPAYSATSAISSYAEFSNATNGGVASDLCSLTTLTVSYIDVATGTHPIVVTRTWTLTDAAGNPVNCIQTIEVDDTVDPEITGIIAESTIEGCDQDDAPAAATTVGALEALGVLISDACSSDLELVVTSDDVFNNAIPLELTRTYTVTDGSDNSSEIVQVIKIVDTTDPTFTCPSNIIVYATANTTSAYVTIPAVIASDNCGGVVTLENNITLTDNASGTFNLGTTLVTYIATDASGNETECSFNVTVQQLPSFLTEFEDVQCFQGNDGWIKVTPNSGTAPYSYSIDNGTTYTAPQSGSSFKFENLPASTYHIRIKDANGIETPSCITLP